MRNVARLLILSALIGLLASCNRGPDPNAIQVGMTAEQVRALCGEPKILGGANSNINGVITTRENWTYPMGDSGLVVVLENGKVISKKVRPNVTRAWLAKVHAGMSKQAVITAIGDTTQKIPAGKPNPIEKEPTEKWFYTDKEAPVEILMVHFRNDKVVKAECSPNGIYTGQTAPGMPGPFPR